MVLTSLKMTTKSSEFRTGSRERASKPIGALDPKRGLTAKSF